MRTYDTYKDSGISWLGQIPSHWDVKRLGSYFTERRQKVSDKDYEPLSVTKQGIFPQLENVAKTNDGDNRKLVRKGDFVINSRSDRKGSSGVSELDGSVSLINIVLEPHQSIIPTFCNFLLKSHGFIEEYYRIGRGIVADLWTTRYQEMKFMPLAVPPLAEQEAIVAYLDGATAEIDKAIASQQHMVELLQERKQIIIESAVTKGIDSNAEFKDSGLKYLGLIPNTWNTIRLGYCSWIRARLGWKGLTADEYVDEGYPFLSAFNIINNLLVWSPLNFISKFRFDESPEIKLRVGDILLVKDGAGIGKCARVDDLPCGEATANGSLAFITPDDTFDYRYLYYFLISNCFKQFTELLINGQGVPHLTQEVLKRVRVPRPPKEIQVRIVEQLDKAVKEINASIASCDVIINKLQERKHILINDVVTGKIKII